MKTMVLNDGNLIVLLAPRTHSLKASSGHLDQFQQNDTRDYTVSATMF